jgi:hypothetical protein
MKPGKNNLLASIPGLVLAAACSTGAGDGGVWGSLELPECGVETSTFDMDVSFFGADYFENTLTIRLQRTGQDPTFTDGVVLLVRDVEAAEETGGAEQRVVTEPTIEEFLASGPDAGLPATTASSPARVTLYLNETCPGNHLAFTDGAGTLVLEKVYVPGEQKRIRGSFRLEFVDPRQWDPDLGTAPYADLEGEFDFNYTRGKPAQTYP